MDTKLEHSIMPHDIPRVLFVRSTSTPQECQQKAAECLRLIQTFRNSRNKAILLEMAEAWITRAEQQKASTSIVVC